MIRRMDDSTHNSYRRENLSYKYSVVSTPRLQWLKQLPGFVFHLFVDHETAQRNGHRTFESDINSRESMPTGTIAISERVVYGMLTKGFNIRYS